MDKQDSKKKKSEKIERTSDLSSFYIPSTARTGLTHDDILQGLLEDIFTPDSEFEEMSNSENSNDSIIRPLGDASKIDCQTAREVMKKLLDGEDIFDAEL